MFYDGVCEVFSPLVYIEICAGMSGKYNFSFEIMISTN